LKAQPANPSAALNNVRLLHSAPGTDKSGPGDLFPRKELK
jgi:hypothetical protein